MGGSPLLICPGAGEVNGSGKNRQGHPTDGGWVTRQVDYVGVGDTRCATVLNCTEHISLSLHEAEEEFHIQRFNYLLAPGFQGSLVVQL